ncbi:MAG: UDP-N-acetylmuramate dehydrogenase [Ignavibacteriales bacterium]|nr:UDP-N-acetylmuramate dehydrogenase [Ignavibacteriales bacterium]
MPAGSGVITSDSIRSFFRGRIFENEPLAPYTSMKVGGPASLYLEPQDRDDLVAVIRHFREQHFPFLMIGRGSNMIISDEGFPGAAINLESGFSDVSLVDGDVVAEAGARLTKLVDFCVQHSLQGLEWAAGIPGSVGGAVVMNAGAHGSEMKNHIVEVEALRGTSIATVKTEDAGFGYRTSGFTQDIVLSARFRLSRGDREDILRRKSEMMARRNATQPLNMPNSGSMFINPSGTHAAHLIEQAGLKGKRIGDAQISEKHANFMVNLGSAKAADILKLIDLIRRTVYQNTGVLLELEVKLIGFSEEARASLS